jgi:serine/threonine protein kinase
MRSLRDQGPIAPENVFSIAAAVARALSYLHQKGFAHGNLTPANILIDGMGAVFVTGYVGLFTTDVRYMAPELWREDGGHVSYMQADVFAYGRILHELCCARNIFPGHMPETEVKEVVESGVNVDGVDGVKPGIIALMIRTLRKDPDMRPTAIQIVDKLGTVDCTLFSGASAYQRIKAGEGGDDAWKK